MTYAILLDMEALVEYSSPCVGICELNDSGVCIGCARSPEQIKKDGQDYYEMFRNLQQDSKSSVQQHEDECERNKSNRKGKKRRT